MIDTGKKSWTVYSVEGPAEGQWSVTATLWTEEGPRSPGVVKARKGTRAAAEVSARNLQAAYDRIRGVAVVAP